MLRFLTLTLVERLHCTRSEGRQRLREVACATSQNRPTTQQPFRLK